MLISQKRLYTYKEVNNIPINFHQLLLIKDAKNYRNRLHFWCRKTRFKTLTTCKYVKNLGPTDVFSSMVKLSFPKFETAFRIQD